MVWELVLGFHDIFMLDGHELGYTSAIQHELQITDSEPFKEQFRQIPPPAVLCSMICWMQGPYIPASLPGVMPLYWGERRMEPYVSV